MNMFSHALNAAKLFVIYGFFETHPHPSVVTRSNRRDNTLIIHWVVSIHTHHSRKIKYLLCDMPGPEQKGEIRGIFKKSRTTDC